MKNGELDRVWVKAFGITLHAWSVDIVSSEIVVVGILESMKIPMTEHIFFVLVFVSKILVIKFRQNYILKWGTGVHHKATFPEIVHETQSEADDEAEQALNLNSLLLNLQPRS